MFFEPMLTIPLHRNFSFSLQQLCRATIVSHIKYDGINELQLPSSLKAYLKEYHYKYKVRETPLDESLYQRSQCQQISTTNDQYSVKDIGSRLTTAEAATLPLNDSASIDDQPSADRLVAAKGSSCKFKMLRSFRKLFRTKNTKRKQTSSGS